MVLHRAFFGFCKLAGMCRRNILRVGVVCHQQIVRIDFVHRKQIAHGFAESAKRRVVIEVSNVLTDKGLTIDGKGNGVLKVRAQGKDGPFAWQFGNRAGGVTA